jgi:hypothetical protein
VDPLEREGFLLPFEAFSKLHFRNTDLLRSGKGKGEGNEKSSIKKCPIIVKNKSFLFNNQVIHNEKRFFKNY